MLIPGSWSSLYASDLETRTSVSSHTGTTWFDDANAEWKTARYLASLTKVLEQPRSTSGDYNGPPLLFHATTSFLDLGTGNGSQLFALRRAGWAGPMVGVDYSPESVDLARIIWKEKTREDGDATESNDESTSDEEEESKSARVTPSREAISFYTHDILSPISPSWLPPDGYDVVLDKGTFDAISLSAEIDSKGKRICEGYALAVKSLVKRGGMLLVTSCNWTEEELEEWIVGTDKRNREEDRFEVCGRVPYHRFKFGGVEGQSVVGVAFRRK